MGKLLEFQNLSSKKSDFIDNTINNPTEFDNWFESISSNPIKDEFIFRGLPEAKYKIYSSAQKLWNERGFVSTFGDDNQSYFNFIQNLISNCRSWQGNLLEKYFDKLDHNLSDIALFAIMQHYGLPTPLIDFTKNLNTAIYFALKDIKHISSENEIDDYFSIYTINLSENKDRLLHLTELYKIEGEQVLSYSELASKERIIYLDSDNSKELNLIKYSNFNIINQEGVFIFNYHPWKYVSGITGVTYLHKLKLHFKSPEPDFAKDIPILKQIDCANIHKSLIEYIRNKYLSDYSDLNIFPTFENLRDSAIKKTLEEIKRR